MLDEEVKKYLKSNQDEALFKLYDFYKAEFMHYVNRYGLSNDDVLDIYQDAFIALRENAIKGKLENLSSSVKTYFFAIGKYMVFSKLKENKKSLNVEFMEPLLEHETNVGFLEAEEENPSVAKLQKALINMGGKCQELLRLFYFEEKKLDEIVQLMSYENKDVAKSQKSRCIKNLKNLLSRD